MRSVSSPTKVLSTIRSEVINIEDPVTGAISIKGWFSRAKYYPADGMVTVDIDPEILPYVLNDTVLSLGFTKFRLEEIRAMRSIRTIRVYEHIAMNEYKRIWRISIADFRKLLDIGADKYPKFAQLHKAVINPIVAEINNTPDSRLRVKCEFDKCGTRHAIDLVFHIDRKDRAGQKIVINKAILAVIPPRLQRDEGFIGCIKNEIAFNSDYTVDEMRNIVLHSIVNCKGKVNMAAWLKHCFENGLGKEDGRHPGQINDICVTWTNVPDDEMWTDEDGGLDLDNGTILPAENVKELLRTGMLVRVR